MKQVIAIIITFVWGGTLFGMIVTEKDYESRHSVYEIVKCINQRLLPDYVKNTLITIVGCDEQRRDDEFFSFLFPENLQQCRELPRFIFTDLFENLDIYKYYRSIFEGVIHKKTEEKRIISMQHYLTGQIGDKKCPAMSCVDYELYKLGKKFFTILTYLQQKRLCEARNNMVAFDDLYSKCQHTILCGQVRFLLSISYPQERYDILLFEKACDLLFLNSDLQKYQNTEQDDVHNTLFDKKELQIKQDAGRIYSENIKDILKQTIWRKCFTSVDDVDDMHFIDLFLSFQKSKEFFIAHEIGLMAENDGDGCPSLFIAQRN